MIRISNKKIEEIGAFLVTSIVLVVGISRLEFRGNPFSNSFKFKTKKGSTIVFYEQDVSCEKIPFSMQFDDSKYDFNTTYVKCRANGVRTTIVGNRFAYSAEEICDSKDETYTKYIPCIAGKYFKKYDPNDKTNKGGGMARYFDEKDKYENNPFKIEPFTMPGSWSLD